MAWRESRASRRRLLLFGSAISVGVAALVAIGSFTDNLERAVRREARALLGADLQLSSSRPFTRPVEALLDSLGRSGVPVVRRMTFSSMGYLRRTAPTRLLDVRALGPGFPFYGEVVTSPAGRWQALDTGRVAIVDTALMVALDARLGDTLELGNGRFVITATVSEVPGHLAGGVNAFGAQVYIPLRHVAETGLIVFGSRVRYSALLKFPDAGATRKFENRQRRLLQQERVSAQSAQDTERELTEALDNLSSFLQFVGLIALLLGGIGVASGVAAFLAGKLETVAVLRCLGASRPLVFAIYLSQAASLGLVSALAGVALGVGLQLLLPHLLGDVLPVTVRVTPAPGVMMAGVGIGLAVALLFALRPLLEVRLVSPLQAIRRAFETDGPAPRDPWKLAARGALVIFVAALCFARNEDPAVGAGFAAAILLAVALLTLAARGAVGAARRLTLGRARAHLPYLLRQGMANLHRPRNQTRGVVTALGFGVALLAALYLVQTNLLRQVLRGGDQARTRPNLVFIDIQADQIAGLRALVREPGHPLLQEVPLVPMRIAAVNGRTPQQLLADTGARRPAGWTLRREYRSTWRDTLVRSERLVRGALWRGRGEARGGAYPLSLSTDVAADLKVGVGDAITWNVQGATIETRVVALREVDWARFEPNFFAVFSTAALERAPVTWVLLTKIDDAAARARLQRDVIERFPNVTSVDVALVQRTIERVFNRVALAVRFMAGLSLTVGALVLLGAVAAGRLQRIREGALLKTLGATRRQLERILLSEYLVLGLLAAAVGVGLATAGAWAFTHWVLELGFQVPVRPLASVLGLTALAVAVVGVTASREVFRRTAMDVLRDV
jgi:putative ABC transport system permease protein